MIKLKQHREPETEPEAKGCREDTAQKRVHPTPQAKVPKRHFVPSKYFWYFFWVFSQDDYPLLFLNKSVKMLYGNIYYNFDQT